MQPLECGRRMSDMDAIFWDGESDPLLRSPVLGLSFLSTVPAQKAVYERLARAVHNIPRMRQRVVDIPFGLSTPLWAEDPHFDLDYHVRWVSASGPDPQRSLRKLVDTAAMQPFDPTRPLWEVTIVEGLPGGKAAVIQKQHHAVNDGLGCVEQLRGVYDTEPAPPRGEALLAPPRREALPGPWELLRDAAQHELRCEVALAKKSAQELAGVLRAPVASLRGAAAQLRTTVSAHHTSGPVASPIVPARSASARFHAFAVPMEPLHAAARSVGCKLNDAFLAALAAGFRRYYERHRVIPREVRLGVAMSVRAAADKRTAGNQVQGGRVVLPLTLPSPTDTMRAMQAKVRTHRSVLHPELTRAGLRYFRRLPTGVKTRVMRGLTGSVDAIVSNVPGPRTPLFLAGARLEGIFAMIPLLGTPATVSLLSYDHVAHIGLTTDPAAIPDGNVLLECLRAGFEDLQAMEERCQSTPSRLRCA